MSCHQPRTCLSFPWSRSVFPGICKCQGLCQDEMFLIPMSNESGPETPKRKEKKACQCHSLGTVWQCQNRLTANAISWLKGNTGTSVVMRPRGQRWCAPLSSSFPQLLHPPVTLHPCPPFMPTEKVWALSSCHCYSSKYGDKGTHILFIL